MTFLFYSHTGPARPLWLHTWTLPESSPCPPARREASHLAVKTQEHFSTFLFSFTTSNSSSRSSSPERHQCKWWAPEAPAGPCSCWTATSRWLPHTWRGTRHTFQKRCCLQWGNGWGIETREGNTWNGRAGSRDWPQLLVESVSRLATVLDLDSPPKLESTDFSRGSETQFLPAGQKVYKSVRMKCICVDVLCFWCWSHCSASCCCCAAFWPSGTSFTMTNHCLVPSPASSATWITTEHNVKHSPSQKSTEIIFTVHWRSSQ